MTYRLAAVGGDVIGPEVTAAALEVLAAVGERGGPRFTVEEYPWGAEYHLRHGRPMPQDALDRLLGADAVLLGAVGDPRVPDHILVGGIVIRIRQAFDLYVNLRPVRLLPGVPSPLSGATPERVDMLVVRENSEGEYVDLGGRLRQGTPDEEALQTACFTRRGVERIARYAFELARARGRTLVSVTKSNALRHSMAFWDEVVQDVARDFPDVRWESMLADAAALHMVRSPERFGVVLASNLFGDILSDLGAALAGGMGVAAGANLDPTHRRPSMFEPIHGSAPDIAGRGVANPVAAISCLALLLDHLGERPWAEAVEQAVATVLREGAVRTPDLGGRAGTTEVTREIVAALAAPAGTRP